MNKAATYGLSRVKGFVLATMLLFPACTNERPERTPEGKIPVEVYLLLISNRQVDYYRWAEETFESRNPDIDIQIEQFPGSSVNDFEIKLRLRYASRQAPEVFHLNQVFAHDLARRGLLSAAPDTIQEMVRSNSLNDFVATAPVVDDTLYGITSDAVWTALYYNKTHFREVGLDPEKPPSTWPELVTYADQLTLRRDDGTPIRSGFGLRKTGFKPGTAEKWLTFLFSAGGEAFDSEGITSRFNSPAGRRAMALYDTLLNVVNADDITLEGDELDFANGRTSMFLRESYVIRMLEDQFPDVDFGLAPVPHDVRSVAMGGAYLFAVNGRASIDKQAAGWRFVQFLMDDEGYRRYVETGGVMPATRSIANLPEWRDDPHLSVFLNQKVETITPFTDYYRAVELLGSHIERFCYGKSSRDQALEEAQIAVDKLLARNR